MRGQNEQELLEVKSIGSLNRPGVARHKEEITVDKITSKKPDFNRDFQSVINWLDRNVLPYISLVLLSGLAYKGLSDFLPVMNQQATAVVAVLGVSFLVVKLRSNKV